MTNLTIADLPAESHVSFFFILSSSSPFIYYKLSTSHSSFCSQFSSTTHTSYTPISNLLLPFSKLKSGPLLNLNLNLTYSESIFLTILTKWGLLIKLSHSRHCDFDAITIIIKCNTKICLVSLSQFRLLAILSQSRHNSRNNVIFPDILSV